MMWKEVLIFGGALLAIESKELDIHVSVGVMLKEHPGAVLYESSIPMIYRIPTVDTALNAPFACERICDWKTQGPGALGHKTVDGNKIYSGQRGCQIIHASYDILQTNRKLLKQLENQDTPSPAPDRFARETSERVRRVPILEPIGNLLELLSGVPSYSTFRQVTTHVNYIEKFMKRLQSMSSKKEENFIKLGTAVSKITKETKTGFDIITKEMKNISFAYNLLQKEYGDTDLALISLGTAVGDAMALQHGVLSYMWLEKARDICLTKKIPSLLLPATDLAKDLRDLRKELDKQQYKMSVPNYEINLYYKLAIADCVWEKRDGILRVQIPIVKAQSSWQLYSIQTIPYAYHNRTCYIDLDTTYVAKNNEEIAPFENHDAKDCLSSEGFLCQIPKYGNKASKENTCIKKILGGAKIEELQTICPVTCHLDNEPSVSLQAPRTYVVTHAGNNRAVIECPSKTTSLKGPDIGALSVELPCNCALIIDSERKDQDSYPCVAPHIRAAVINHTLPAIFSTKYGKVKIAANRPIPLPIDQNISNILDPDIDIFNADSVNFKKLDEEEEFIPPLPAFMDEQFDSSHVIIFAWLIMLSVVAGWMFLFNKPLPTPVTALALGTLVPKAEGRPVHYTPVCRLPTHVDVCLWLYLAWMVFLTLPHAMRTFKKLYDRCMLQRALKKTMEESSERNLQNSLLSTGTNRRMEELDNQMSIREQMRRDMDAHIARTKAQRNVTSEGEDMPPQAMSRY